MVPCNVLLISIKQTIKALFNLKANTLKVMSEIFKSILKQN